jgi:hypothetical protein
MVTSEREGGGGFFPLAARRNPFANSSGEREGEPRVFPLAARRNPLANSSGEQEDESSGSFPLAAPRSPMPKLNHQMTRTPS